MYYKQAKSIFDTKILPLILQFGYHVTIDENNFVYATKTFCKYGNTSLYNYIRFCNEKNINSENSNWSVFFTYYYRYKCYGHYKPTAISKMEEYKFTTDFDVNQFINILLKSEEIIKNYLNEYKKYKINKDFE